MHIANIKQLGALQVEKPGRVITNVSFSRADFLHFKAFARQHDVNFSALTRAALRVLEERIAGSGGTSNE
jgi:hypothetical protein